MMLVKFLLTLSLRKPDHCFIDFQKFTVNRYQIQKVGTVTFTPCLIGVKSPIVIMIYD